MNAQAVQSQSDRLGVSLGRRGFALAAMLCAVVILLIIGVGLLQFGLQGRRLAVSTSSGIASRCAADAGLTKALYEMNEKLKVLPWDNSNLPKLTDEILMNTDASHSYAVTGDLNNGHFAESMGNYGLEGKTIRCSFPLQGLFEYAIFGDEYIHLTNGGTVDWYNYDTDDKSLQIGTNSTIADSVVLDNGAILNGDVVIGAGGDPDVVINKTTANITGNTYVMPKEYDLPLITVPDWLATLPSGGTINNSITISSSAKYDNIDIGNNHVITIDGEVSLYIAGDIILDNTAELQIIGEDNVSLTLYVDGNIISDNSGTINNLSKDATQLVIYGLDDCLSIILNNDIDFYGAIYAPNADIVMMNSGDVYGSVVGNSIDQTNAATFNYDASLREVSVEDIGVRFVIKQWRE